MLRALFLQELRRSWLAHAGLFAVVFGPLALGVRLARMSLLPSEANLLFAGFLLGGLLLSGLISGERCFSAAFKEGRYAFLLTLPRPRGGIWLAYLGGRLSGALAALPVVGLLLAGRALRLQWQAPWGWPFLLAALSVYLVYFLGSAALALVFRKEILVYIVAFPLLTGLLALFAGNASYGIAPTEQFRDDLLESSQYLRAFACVSLLLAMTWTAVGLRAFCRGELHLSRRAMRTFAEGGLASAALAGLALVAYGSSTLAAIDGTWSPKAAYTMESRPFSADGRFLSIGQQLRERPAFTRLAVVDLEDGNTTRWLARPGLQQISWSASEPVLNVLAVDDTPAGCLGMPCQGSTSWYRLSPDLRVLSIRKFPGTGFLRHLDGCLLLVTREGNVGRMYRLSDRDGSFAEIVSQKLDDDPRAWTLDGGAVVEFPTTTTLRAWWLDPQGRVRHEDSVRRRGGDDQSHYLVGHRILFFDEIRAEAMQHGFPPLPNRPERWEPLLPTHSYGPLDFSSGRLYLEGSMKMGTLWWRDEERETWIRIAKDLHPADFGRIRMGFGPNPFFRFGIVAAVVLSEGHRQLSLFDSRLGRSIPSSVACPGEEGFTNLNLTQMQGLEGPLVHFSCWDQAGLFLGSRFLEVVPGSGRVRDVTRLSPIVASRHVSRQIRQWIQLDPEGVSVWVSTTGEVWQTGPGRKSLRLNPPAE